MTQEMTHNELAALIKSLARQMDKDSETLRDVSLDMAEIKVEVKHMADTVKVLDEVVLHGRGHQAPLSQAVPQLTMMIETFVEDQKASRGERRRLTATFRAAIIPAVLSSITALVIAIITLITT
jgi:hypothetical protein